MHTEYLRTKKILYAIVDPAQISGLHHLLYRKIFDLTYVLAQRLSTIASGQVKAFDTIDDAMTYGRFWDLVIVQSVGNFIIDYRFLKELDEFCTANTNFVLLASPSTPRVGQNGIRLEFDTRMMVVNVDAWRSLAYPDLHEKRSPPVGSAVHNTCKPVPNGGLYEPSPGMKSRRMFLDDVISRGLTVHPFPASFSDCSLYIHPEFESSRLYEGLVMRDETLVSNADQKRWIRLSIPRSTIWIYNSEPYRFYVSPRECDAYFGPAAGFKYLDMLSYNPNAEFLFYDHNEESLEWIETLKENWSGNDFVGFVNRQPEGLKRKFKYVYSSIEQNQQRLFDGFGGEENFMSLWRLFKGASARFFRCDLFDCRQVRELTSKTNAKRPFFYYSNIFSTLFTLTAFSREEAETKYMHFKALVKNEFPAATMHGADVSGRWH